MFAGQESCADHYVCKRGGAAPPPTPRCFKAIHASNKEKTSCHHHVCRKGGLCGSLRLQIGELPPPNPPAASKPSMSAITKKHHVITRFVAKEGCAAYVVRRSIFSEYILNQISHCKQRMDLKHSSYRIYNGMVIPLKFQVSLFVPPIPPNAHFFARELVQGVEPCKTGIRCRLTHVKLSKASRRCHLQRLKHSKTSRDYNVQHLKRSKTSKCYNLQRLTCSKTSKCCNLNLRRSKTSKCCNLQHLKHSKTSTWCNLQHLRCANTSKWCNL